MDLGLDEVLGQCYFVDNEAFESEELLDTFDFHDATLKNTDKGCSELNHCTVQSCVTYYLPVLPPSSIIGYRNYEQISTCFVLLIRACWRAIYSWSGK